ERRGLVPLSANLISIDERRRAILRVLEDTLARRNTESKAIGLAKTEKNERRFRQLMAKVGKYKEDIQILEAEEKAVSKELDQALAQIPNLPLEDVPEGSDANDNVEYVGKDSHHRFGVRRNYSFLPKQHFELGETLGMMDFETAAKLSGSRFVVLKKSL